MVRNFWPVVYFHHGRLGQVDKVQRVLCGSYNCMLSGILSISSFTWTVCSQAETKSTGHALSHRRTIKQLVRHLKTCKSSYSCSMTMWLTLTFWTFDVWKQPTKNKTVEVNENKRNLFPALSFYIQRVTEELFTIFWFIKFWTLYSPCTITMKK